MATSPDILRFRVEALEAEVIRLRQKLQACARLSSARAAKIDELESRLRVCYWFLGCPLDPPLTAEEYEIAKRGVAFLRLSR